MSNYVLIPNMEFTFLWYSVKYGFIFIKGDFTDTVEMLSRILYDESSMLF